MVLCHDRSNEKKSCNRRFHAHRIARRHCHHRDSGEPSFARIGWRQDRAVRTTCISQNKQFGLAVHMYANDNNDSMTHPLWGNSFPGWLDTPVGGQPPKWDLTDVQKTYGGGQLWKYTGNYRIYFCPTDKTNATANKYWSIRQNKLSTYIMNGAVNGYGALNGNTYKLGAFNPAAYLMWEPEI